MADKIIFITGVSSGLGQALAEEALTQGWRVIGTVRSEEAQQEALYDRGIPQVKIAFWRDFGFMPARVVIAKFFAGAISGVSWPRC